MTEPEQKKGQARHWMRPLKGEWRTSRHLLVWPIEERRGPRVTAPSSKVVLYEISATGDPVQMDQDARDEDTLEKTIDRATQMKGTLTIWLPAGWEHLVLSGLAEAIDAGILTWRYCHFEGERLIVRGLWRGRQIIICSLANWTGGRWDQWRDKAGLEGEQLFLASWYAAAVVSRSLHLGSLAPSAGAAGMLLWRSWLGPRVHTVVRNDAKSPQDGRSKPQQYVGPLPSRPLRARNAERHVAYGLVCRHLRRGLIEGPIYAVDVSVAYLLYLLTTPCPVMYTRTLHRPAPDELCGAMDGHTGCALVHLYSADEPYPVRRGGRVVWATGDYWTWLAGAELADALCARRVQAVESAHVWWAQMLAGDDVGRLMALGDALADSGQRLEAAAWRSIYSQLVGRFAAWKRTWKDTTSHQQFGRWAAWLEADRDTGAIVQHRSIAGRVQKLSAKEDTGDSVPLLFGCVTAQGRYITRSLAAIAGRENVVCVEADALWVTPAGWQAIQRAASAQGIAPDMLKCKEVYDAAWMSGERISVVRTGGQLYLRCPGVPGDVAVGAGGRVEWPSRGDWHADGPPKRSRGVKRGVAHYSVERIMRDYGGAPIALPWAERIDDPMMGAELLEPLGGGGKKVDDER